MNILILLILFINTHKNTVYKYVATTRLELYGNVVIKSPNFHQLSEEEAKIYGFSRSGMEMLSKELLGEVRSFLLEENAQLTVETGSQTVLTDSGKKMVKIASNQPDLSSVHRSASVKGIKQAQPCQDGEKRRQISNLLQSYIGAQEYPVVEGILLGGSSQLTKQQKDQVKTVGLSHILSASGSNVSLFLILNSPNLWKRFGKFFTGLITFVFILSYLQIAGCSAPLVRASLSTGFAIAGVALSQQVTSLWLLMVTCMVMLASQPEYLTNIGFQLSVAATLGIVVVSKALPKRKARQIDTSMLYITQLNYQSVMSTASFMLWLKKLKALANYITVSCKEVMLLTCAAQLATLPITVFYFKELSLSAVFSNTAVLWTVPLILYSAIATACFSVLRIHILATLSGAVTTICTHFFLTVVELFSRFTFALLKLSDFASYCILFVYFLSILIYSINQKFNKKSTCKIFLSH